MWFYMLTLFLHFYAPTPPGQPPVRTGPVTRTVNIEWVFNTYAECEMHRQTSSNIVGADGHSIFSECRKQ